MINLPHWLTATALTCFSITVSAMADDAAEPATKYRVIFNSDGHAVCQDAGGDVNQWVENLFGPLEDSHVEALFWCDGAGGNTANYRSEVLELTGERIGEPRASVQTLLDAGHDPPEVVVREAKKRQLDIFYSFRINDIHDAFMPDELATFKVEHPEWLIGEQQYGQVTSFRTSLNFAVPEVRDLKFRVIEELFQKYDFDGLEIDFMRSAPYFLPGEEAKNAHLLTELLQRVRSHLQERGRERGRPIRLAVRVDESLRACRLNGFQVSEWINQGLIDYLILGSGVIDIEVEAFKTLAAPNNVLVYPCLYGWPSKYNPIPAELATGIALNYWQQNADGIYLFNWFPHTANNSESTSPHLARLLKQIGDPQTLLTERPNLMFAADRGRPERAYHNNWLNCILPAPLSVSDPLVVPFQVGTNLQQRPPSLTASLQIVIEELQADDHVEVLLNGDPIEGLQRNPGGPLTAPVNPDRLPVGRNQATLRLARKSAASDAPRMVIALEVHVRNPVPMPQNARLIEQHQLARGRAEQGLALSEDAFYSATSRKLFRYDTDWNLIAEKEIRIDGVNHLGAIHYHDGSIWAGLLHGPEGGKHDKSLDRAVIAQIRATDFEVVHTWNISNDVTWIDPVCFDGTHLWVGDLSDLGIHRYRLEGDQLQRDGILRYPREMHFSQGIRVRGNRLYSMHTFGSMDGLYEFAIPPRLSDTIHTPLRVWDIQETHMHLEGFDFVPGHPDQIWHAQGEHVDRYVLQGITDDKDHTAK